MSDRNDKAQESRREEVIPPNNEERDVVPIINRPYYVPIPMESITVF
jgi:hypothetical protein